MPSSPKPISNAIKWTICGVAALGFLFDIYEILVAPLVVQPALLELGGLRLGTAEYRSWAGLFLWIPPLLGGFCGLWGGYFTDRLGRRRILVWSILLYTTSAVAAGFATTLPMLLTFRTLCYAGVCVEFVAAVAWLAELFPDNKTREAVLGYTQMFSSMGGVLVSGIFFLSSRYGAALPAIYGSHSAWRYTLLGGVLPAIPLMIIRPFLPESPQWAAKKAAGTLKRPSIAELFRPKFRRVTVITTLMFACAYGAAIGTIQQGPQIAGGMPEVSSLPLAERGQATSSASAAQEFGGLAGRLTMATLGLIIISRRKLLRLFLVPGLILMPIVFLYTSGQGLQLFRMGMFLAGFTTVAQLNFLGNYLPRVFPVYLRGTGEGFAANVGGRMMGASFSFIVTHLAGVMPGATPGLQLAYAAGAIGICVYATSLVATWWLPEPPADLED
ncbi:MAG: MFS transporter [Acidobacteriota bacterium]